MRSFDEHLELAARLHQSRGCPGLVLGTRMALLGCRLLGISPPDEERQLFVFVEMDRCFADAIAGVTGCRLGKRTLKYLDYGKQACTFYDDRAGRAVRIVTRDQVAQYAGPEMERERAQAHAYRVMSDEELFVVQEVQVEIPPEDRPGRSIDRAFCAACGEEVHDRRQVYVEGRPLCRACAEGSYFVRRGSLDRPVGLRQSRVERPLPIVSVVGRSDVGRTTLLEKLIPELKRRGYRVATIKHHAHPGFEVDKPGKDTWRHAQAGSDQVVIAAPDRVAAIRYVPHALTLDEIATTLIQDVDIILTEGYRRARKPQIEVLRAARGTEPICDPEDLFAIASDVPLSLNVPCFDLDDALGLADLIEVRFLRQSPV
jgi:molybdopterin-guanine dinucleotide biosynthesis protein MobB